PPDSSIRGKPTQLAPTAAPVTHLAPPQGQPPAAGAKEALSSSADFHLGEAPPVANPAGGSSGEFDLGEIPATGSPSGALSDELIPVRPEGSSDEFELGELPPSTTPSGTAIEDLVEIQMSGQSSDVGLTSGPTPKPGSDVGMTSDMNLAAPQEAQAPVGHGPADGAEDID